MHNIMRHSHSLAGCSAICLGPPLLSVETRLAARPSTPTSRNYSHTDNPRHSFDPT